MLYSLTSLPPCVNNILNTDLVWEDWQLTTVLKGTEGWGIRREEGENNSSRPTQIVEAQGWIINQNGEVPPTATNYQVMHRGHKGIVIVKEGIENGKT
ncbi:MAG: hypothetical protein PUP91_36450 [Rhizonema sp. PD37]|nr:hypothetical protein [Rhizonema sp. PD37]